MNWQLPAFLRGGDMSGAETFRFAQPNMLIFLLALPFIWYTIAVLSRQRGATLRFANVSLLRQAGAYDGRRWRRFLEFMRVAMLALLIVALARPQYGRVDRQTYAEGIDIGLVLDVSLSMQQKDLTPTASRLQVAKAVLEDFVKGRAGDRLAYVIFGAEAATIVPLTLDYGVVQSFIDRTGFNLVNGEATAIGLGLGAALKKLVPSTAKNKVVILLTDGENNAGKVDPLTAAEAAHASKIKVYTIGVGREDDGGGNPFAMGPQGGLDESLLRKMAEMTGGRYFRATDAESLANIYHEIDRLEKTKVESTQFDNFNDLAPWLLFPAIGLLALELLLRATRFVRVP